MKIICTSCNKVLGEQAPFDNSSKIYAKCTDCINKAKEEAAKFKPDPKPGEKQEIALENGIKGILWTPTNKKEKLSLGEMAFSGKKFYCAKDKLEEFQRYLEQIKNEEIEVTFLHSSRIELDPASSGRKKKEVVKPKERKNRSADFNCTVKVTKQHAKLIFDDMAEQNQKVTKLIAELMIKVYKKKRKKHLKK